MRFFFMLLLPLQLLAQKNAILFKDVNVVDVETGQITKQNVLVTGNRIETITSNAIAATKAMVINGAGKHLIPGLWDMHVHVFNNVSERPPNEDYHPLFIANGVTSVREMWTKPKNIQSVERWRNEVAK